MASVVNQNRIDHFNLKLAAKTSQHNLEEFTLMMSRNIDHNSFEILSISSVEEQTSPQYNVTSTHTNPHTTGESPQSAKIIRFPGIK